MNKKEAIAYAQITLDYMQSSKYTGKINPENCFSTENRLPDSENEPWFPCPGA